ncbi:TPA: hypothetical protein ACJF0Z_004604, partial [Salmonella enterica subsp. enterica serovar Reading]
QNKRNYQICEPWRYIAFIQAAGRFSPDWFLRLSPVSAIFRISFKVFRIIVKQNSVSTPIVQISPRRGLSTEPVHNPVGK